MTTSTTTPNLARWAFERSAQAREPLELDRAESHAAAWARLYASGQRLSASEHMAILNLAGWLQRPGAPKPTMADVEETKRDEEAAAEAVGAEDRPTGGVAAGDLQRADEPTDGARGSPACEESAPPRTVVADAVADGLIADATPEKPARKRRARCECGHAFAEHDADGQCSAPVEKSRRKCLDCRGDGRDEQGTPEECCSCDGFGVIIEEAFCPCQKYTPKPRASKKSTTTGGNVPEVMAPYRPGAHPDSPTSTGPVSDGPASACAPSPGDAETTGDLCSEPFHEHGDGCPSCDFRDDGSPRTTTPRAPIAPLISVACDSCAEPHKVESGRPWKCRNCNRLHKNTLASSEATLGAVPAVIAAPDGASNSTPVAGSLPPPATGGSSGCTASELPLLLLPAVARAPAKDADAPGKLDPTFDRRTGIGASEIAAIAGLSPFATALDIYNLKVGLVPSSPDTPWTEAGRYLEPAIARWYADKTKQELEGDGTVTYRHPKHPWIFASPDRLVKRQPRPRKGVQIKNVGWYRREGYGDEGTDRIPEHVACQVTQEASVMTLEEVDVVPLIAGHDFRIYTVVYDPELWETFLFPLAQRFWFEHVLPRRPPVMDGSDGGWAYLAATFPRPKNELVRPATKEEIALALRYEKLSRLKKRIEEARDEVTQKLAQTIGDDLGVKGDGWTFKYLYQKESAVKATVRAAHRKPDFRRKLNQGKVA